MYLLFRQTRKLMNIEYMAKCRKKFSWQKNYVKP